MSPYNLAVSARLCFKNTGLQSRITCEELFVVITDVGTGHVLSAFLTSAILDGQAKPTTWPDVKPQTDVQIHREGRLETRKKLIRSQIVSAYFTENNMRHSFQFLTS
jgi:hypothetical protein